VAALRDPARGALGTATWMVSGLLALQCLLGARLAVFPDAAGSVALPAHAMLGIVLGALGAWLASRIQHLRRRRLGFALALLAPLAGFTALHFENPAAAFAHAVAAALLVVGLLLVKGLALAAIAPKLEVTSERWLFAALLAQAGEFAFVVFGVARGARVLPGEWDALLTAAVALSMAATPLLLLAHDALRKA